MNSMNWMKVFVVALSIGPLASTAAVQSMAQELPKVYDASVPKATRKHAKAPTGSVALLAGTS